MKRKVFRNGLALSMIIPNLIDNRIRGKLDTGSKTKLFQALEMCSNAHF